MPVLTGMSTRTNTNRLNNFRGLVRALRFNMGQWTFREIADEDKKQELINLRSKNYKARHVKESKIDDFDPFDLGARFFVLNGKENGREYISKCIRTVNRKTHGILPSELSLLKLEELVQFSERFMLNKDYESTWRESTMDNLGKYNIATLLEKYNGSDKLYEIGGLFGEDPSLTSSLILMLGIGKIGYKEKWDLVIQTQHPRHVSGYHCIGFPYQEIAGHTQTYIDETGKLRKGYKDHNDRPAITLSLEGERFRRRYSRIQEKISQIIELAN